MWPELPTPPAPPTTITFALYAKAAAGSVLNVTLAFDGQPGGAPPAATTCAVAADGAWRRCALEAAGLFGGPTPEQHSLFHFALDSAGLAFVDDVALSVA